VPANWQTAIQSGQVLNTLGQPQPSVPILAWNNGPEPTCASGGACSGSLQVILNPGTPTAANGQPMSNYVSGTPHKNGDVEYCNGGTTMPTKCGNYANSYRPFTYPYPLSVTAQSPAPSAPTGLRLAQ
jgi:hypothetical protein